MKIYQIRTDGGEMVRVEADRYIVDPQSSNVLHMIRFDKAGQGEFIRSFSYWTEIALVEEFENYDPAQQGDTEEDI